MEKEITEYMISYDTNQAKMEEAEKRASQEDSEGWVTVSKK